MDAASDGGKLAADLGRTAAERGRAAADRARQQARDFDPADLATVAKPIAEGIADVVATMPERIRSLSEDVQQIRPEQLKPDQLGEQIRASAERLVPRRRSSSRIPIVFVMVLAGALGAAIGFLLDPDRGRSRRAETADRLAAYARNAGRSLEGVTHEMRARAAGIQAEMRRSEWAEPLDDVTLAHKVESELFRDPTIPKGRMNINAENGVVILRGRVDSTDEIEQIMAATLAIDGVRTVRSLLKTPDESSSTGDAPRELVRSRPA